ncbi:glycosyltransferase family 2 protein [Methylocaldum sp.]|uniref:glycosyltransferase family 2 protein n=1 Tax=Methylocaldum sp. TaxID=1969727 RepID=UPI002D5C9524|nr:glycosyltransferase family 2 protein [Methylocaldum sp.]HYE37376.1 glycosyltransferase family 2 protein [Methylocaldum sp.]
MKPFFSVVIPAFNRAKEIPACLDSVLAQRWQDFEIIVVDDGSRDATAQVVKSYSNRVRLIRQENQGPGAARNAGIRAANGDYVAFLDSDDLWFPYTLENYAEVIRNYNYPSFLIGSFISFTDETPVLSGSREPVKARYYQDVLSFFRENGATCFFTGTFVAKTKALNRVSGFTEKKVFCEDNDLVLRLAASPGFVRLDSPPALALSRRAGTFVRDMEESYKGIMEIIDTEKNGAYPGGSQGESARWELILFLARAISRKYAEKRYFRFAWDIYRRVVWRQIRGRRWKYVLGLPILLFIGLANRPPG